MLAVEPAGNKMTFPPYLARFPEDWTGILRNAFRRFWVLTLVALVAGLLLVAACDDEDEPQAGADDEAAEGAGTGDTADDAADDGADDATAEGPGATVYPATVTDLLGREVEIAARPQRVVALSPTAVELVYAVGGSVVGRSSTADYPEAAAAAEDVGSAYQPSLEVIASLEADLVVADSVIHAQPQLRAALEELSIPVIFAGAENVEQVYAGLEIVGVALDAQEAAAAEVARIGDAIAEARAAVEASAHADASAVLLISDRDQTLYAAKANSWAGDIFTQLGITNPAADQPDAGPFPGYTAVPVEQLLAFDPTFVFTVTPAPEPAPRLATLVPQIPPFAGLTAVRSEHVLELDDAIFLQSPGPRVVEAVQAIAAALTAE